MNPRRLAEILKILQNHNVRRYKNGRFEVEFKQDEPKYIPVADDLDDREPTESSADPEKEGEEMFFYSS